ncbi:MAG: YedE-related selenium metabolism membrane protein [Halanaerobiales bacterium]|nr:YedE-related selenium metabolism membrane protein [Halanaerobiales bacterium]
MDKRHKLIILTGVIIGFLGALLVKFGNPGNMGFCIACFLRDIAGAVKLHTAGPVQYIRPEIIGLVLGAFFAVLKFKEFKTRGSSDSMLRLLYGVFMMIGALVFLGCPLRAVLRLAGGDLNAIAGLLGFIFGAAIGTFYLKKGFTLGKPTPSETQVSGWILPSLMVGLLVFLLIRPAFIAFSQAGPGAMTTPIVITLIAGLIVGFLAQRSGFCFAGGYRDMMLGKGSQLFQGYIALFASALIFNILFGQFKLGFTGQPGAHSDHLWSFLGMALVGICAILAGGCPLRQLMRSADGNLDNAIVVIGMILGAGFSHNFGLAGSGKGVTSNGQIAVLIGLVTVLITGYFFTEAYRTRKNQKNSSVAKTV